MVALFVCLFKWVLSHKKVAKPETGMRKHLPIENRKGEVMRRHVGLLLSVSFIILFLSSVANASYSTYSYAEAHESYNGTSNGYPSVTNGGAGAMSASVDYNNNDLKLTADADSAVRGDHNLGAKASALDTVYDKYTVTANAEAQNIIRFEVTDPGTFELHWDYTGTLSLGDWDGYYTGKVYVSFGATLRGVSASGYQQIDSDGGTAWLGGSGWNGGYEYFANGALEGATPTDNVMNLSASNDLIAELEAGTYEIYYTLYTTASSGSSSGGNQTSANFSDSYSSFIILHYQYQRITIEANSERIARCGVNPPCSSSRAIRFF